MTSPSETKIVDWHHDVFFVLREGQLLGGRVMDGDLDFESLRPLAVGQYPLITEEYYKAIKELLEEEDDPRTPLPVS